MNMWVCYVLICILWTQRGWSKPLRSTCCCVTKSPQKFYPLLDRIPVYWKRTRTHSCCLLFVVQGWIRDCWTFLLSFLFFKSTLWVQMMHQLNQTWQGSWVVWIYWLDYCRSIFKTSHLLYFFQYEYAMANQHPFSSWRQRSFLTYITSNMSHFCLPKSNFFWLVWAWLSACVQFIHQL